jgi:hypothetical protein
VDTKQGRVGARASCQCDNHGDKNGYQWTLGCQQIARHLGEEVEGARRSTFPAGKLDMKNVSGQ